MLLFDVVVFDTYALLIGDDAHKIIYHSIYNGIYNYFIMVQDLLTIILSTKQFSHNQT